MPGVPLQTVTQLIESNVGNYCAPENGEIDSAKQSHLKNEKGEFVFVSLIFNDTSTGTANTSQGKYEGYLASGAVDIKNIGFGTENIDTTHQFVTLDIIVEIPGIGQQVAGKALFYNHNYKAQTAAEE